KRFVKRVATLCPRLRPLNSEPLPLAFRLSYGYWAEGARKVKMEIRAESSNAKPAPRAETKQKLLPAAIAVVTASAMLFWGMGLHPRWWLTWFAPLPLLIISPRLGRWGAFSVAALSWFIGSLNMWHYLLSALVMPLPLVLVLSVVPACLLGVAVLLFRTFILGGAPWRAVLAFPTFWVTAEYLNNVTSRHGTFPNMGYTQMDFLPVLQVTALV